MYTKVLSLKQRPHNKFIRKPIDFLHSNISPDGEKYGLPRTRLSLSRGQAVKF